MLCNAVSNGDKYGKRELLEADAAVKIGRYPKKKSGCPAHITQLKQKHRRFIETKPNGNKPERRFKYKENSTVKRALLHERSVYK